MHQVDKQRLVISAIVLTIVCIAVAVIDRSPTISRLLSPAAAESSHARASSTPQLAQEGDVLLVNINTAGAAELMTLSGIGQSKADAVISHREAHGPFYAIEDLQDVRGFGPSLVESLRERVTVGEVGTRPPERTKTTSGEGTKKTKETAGAAFAARANAHVVITEVMPGSNGNAFIELYNIGPDAADLSSWSIKKKTSTGSVSTLMASARLKGKTIPAGKYFLIAGSGYTAAPPADITWPASYSFARSNNALLLYNGAELIETVAWTDIPEGKSYARSTPQSALFELATPQPQNSSR